MVGQNRGKGRAREREIQIDVFMQPKPARARVRRGGNAHAPQHVYRKPRGVLLTANEAVFQRRGRLKGRQLEPPAVFPEGNRLRNARGCAAQLQRRRAGIAQAVQRNRLFRKGNEGCSGVSAVVKGENALGNMSNHCLLPPSAVSKARIQPVFFCETADANGCSIHIRRRRWAESIRPVMCYCACW